MIATMAETTRDGEHPIRWSGVATLVATGTVVATLGDAMHVHTGTLTYTHPRQLGQAWWVPLGFALTFLTMALVYRVLAARLSGVTATQRSRAPGDVGAFVETMAAFGFAYLVSGFGSREPTLLASIFYFTFLVRWAFTYERAWLLLLSVLMAAGGMVGEGLLGTAGLVAYAHADIFHVPWWLGGLYMHGAFALREGMRAHVYRR